MAAKKQHAALQERFLQHCIGMLVQDGKDMQGITPMQMMDDLSTHACSWLIWQALYPIRTGFSQLRLLDEVSEGCEEANFEGPTETSLAVVTTETILTRSQSFSSKVGGSSSAQPSAAMSAPEASQSAEMLKETLTARAKTMAANEIILVSPIAWNADSGNKKEQLAVDRVG